MAVPADRLAWAASANLARAVLLAQVLVEHPEAQGERVARGAVA
jgi:hypothetical protein